MDRFSRKVKILEIGNEMLKKKVITEAKCSNVIKAIWDDKKEKEVNILQASNNFLIYA